jgi:hypothetical protein
MNDQNNTKLTDEKGDFRSYYYYQNDETKIDVQFKKKDDSTYERTESTYYVKQYPSVVAENVRDRLTWGKFGKGLDSDNNTFTRVCDEVFIEINPAIQPYLKKKKEKQNIFEHNVKTYYDLVDVNNQKNESSRTIKNYETMQFQCEVPTKSLVSCRHCKVGDHWSFECPTLKLKKSHSDGDRDNGHDKGYDKEKRYKKETDKDGPRIQGLKLTDMDHNLDNNEIKQILSKYGNITYFNNIMKGEKNSLIYVTFSTKEENDNAYDNLQGKPIGYSIPGVEYAKVKKY